MCACNCLGTRSKLGKGSPIDGVVNTVCRLLSKRAKRSLVMKTNNCLRLRVLSPGVHVSSTGVRMCPQLAYVSSPGEYVFASNMSSPRIDAQAFQRGPPTLGVYAQKSYAYHPVFKSIKILDGDSGMDRCHYALPFKGISIRSTPEIVLS